MSSSLSMVLERLESRTPLPPLLPKETWDSELSKQIEQATDQLITDKEEPSALAVKATRSGLLLWNDDLHTSHNYSQEISEPLGSYWHGIMHRREGDYGNSKYWFRKAGAEHPVYDSLFQQGCEIWPELKSWGTWKPDRFVDEIERVVSAGNESSERGEALKKIQVLEMALLLRYSLEQ